MGKKAAVAALVTGVAFIAYLTVHELENQKIIKYGRIAQAEWTGETHKLLFGLTSFGFNFQTVSGQMVAVSLSPKVTPEQLRNGEPVQIRYLETDPRKTARIVGNERGKSYIFWIVSFLMLAYGVYGFRSAR